MLFCKLSRLRPRIEWSRMLVPYLYSHFKLQRASLSLLPAMCGGVCKTCGATVWIGLIIGGWMRMDGGELLRVNYSA